MNDIDKKILSLLQINADIPIAELSKKFIEGIKEMEEVVEFY